VSTKSWEVHFPKNEHWRAHDRRVNRVRNTGLPVSKLARLRQFKMGKTFSRGN
jgi:hypothetical protein